MFHTAINVWKEENVRDSFFYSILDPFIRFKRVDAPQKTIYFFIVDKLSSFEFCALYSSEKKTFAFQSSEEHLTFLIEKYNIAPEKKLKGLLKKVLKLYVKEHGVKFAQKKLTVKDVEEIEKKTFEHYRSSWKLYTPKIVETPTRVLVKELLVTKKILMTELIRTFLKEEVPHIHVKPRNSFFWVIELDAQFFHKKFTSLAIDLKELDSNVVIEVRFLSTFPKKAPVIRIVSPTFICAGIHKMITYGGIVNEEIKCENVLDMVKKLRKLLIRNKVVLNKTEGSNALYDDKIAIIDFRRIQLHKKIFSVQNRFAERLPGYSPIFHYSNDSTKCDAMEYGNKIILPLKSADRIFKYNPNVKLPLLFELKSKRAKCFCGVSEFSSRLPRAIIPRWMMSQLEINDSDWINVKCVQLPQCTYLKVQPKDPEYFKLVSNSKALLEHQLQKYLTLTIGDSIPVKYGSKIFELYIADLKPSDVVSIAGNKSGFLELNLDIQPPINFDPKKHMNKFELPKREHIDLDDLEDEVSTPIKVEGVQYVKCKNCEHSVKELHYRLHFKHCEKTYFKCNKCSKVLKLEVKETHMNEYHMMKKCHKCHMEMEQYLLKKHQEECSNRMVHCQYFNCPIIAKELKEHEWKCGSKTEKCLKCLKYVFVRDRDVHSINCLYGKTTSDKYYRPPQKYFNEKKKVSPTIKGNISDMDYQISKILEKSYLNQKSSNDNNQDITIPIKRANVENYLKKFPLPKKFPSPKPNDYFGDEDFKRALEVSKMEHEKLKKLRKKNPPPPKNQLSKRSDYEIAIALSIKEHQERLKKSKQNEKVKIEIKNLDVQSEEEDEESTSEEEDDESNSFSFKIPIKSPSKNIKTPIIVKNEDVFDDKNEKKKKKKKIIIIIIIIII